MAARRVDLALGLAIPMFCGALAAAQESVEPVLQRAAAPHQAGRVEQAIPEYRAYLKVRPDNMDPRSNLGAALAATGHYSAGREDHQRRIKGRSGEEVRPQ